VQHKRAFVHLWSAGIPVNPGNFQPKTTDRDKCMNTDTFTPRLSWTTVSIPCAKPESWCPENTPSDNPKAIRFYPECKREIAGLLTEETRRGRAQQGSSFY